ncbi:unnamed protein product [Prorocentrum cordatum]|uniref:Uncharacterized protein n=1 Tax=Prorocentrum cordatum TaxID=2364126 RepID=A0ABN9RFK9_9DINO|nr:unnamed protein product [Polarella glacialis]
MAETAASVVDRDEAHVTATQVASPDSSEDVGRAAVFPQSVSWWLQSAVIWGPFKLSRTAYHPLRRGPAVEALGRPQTPCCLFGLARARIRPEGAAGGTPNRVVRGPTGRLACPRVCFQSASGRPGGLATICVLSIVIFLMALFYSLTNNWCVSSVFGTRSN